MPVEKISSLVVDAVPHLPLDKGVINVNTGIMLLDCLPIITMVPCLPVLKLFYHKRRWGDFFFYSLGFFLAVVYHLAHIEGLENSNLLGIPGSLWRSLDILCAQTLLSRTLGHAVGAHTSLVSGICNAVFPFLLMGWAFVSKRSDGWPPLTLGSASRTLVLVMLAGLASKVAFEGANTMPKLPKKTGRQVLLYFFLGFICFPMPEIYPSSYWLMHSLWHVFLAAGYGLLYEELLHAQQQAELEERRQEAARKRAERLATLRIAPRLSLLPAAVSHRAKAA